MFGQQNKNITPNNLNVYSINYVLIIQIKDERESERVGNAFIYYFKSFYCAPQIE